MANLLHIKGSRNKVLNQFPNNSFGNDGDVVVCNIQGKGIYLCIKSKGTWFASNQLKQLKKLEKTSIDNLKVNQLKAKNTTLTQNELDVPTGDLTLDVAGDIELNADGGDFTFKDGSTTVATLNDDGFTITNPGDSLTPKISIVNSGTDTTDTPILLLDNTGGAENDFIGYILFQGINDAPASQGYADIQCWCLSDDNSSDSEIGQLYFSVKTDGTNSLVKGLEIKGNTSNTVQFIIGSTNNRLVSDASGNLTADFEGDIELNANGGDITFKDDSSNLAALSSSGLTISNITEVGSDTDKILMSDSGVVKYVTGANLRSYIGAGTSSFGGALNDLSDVTYSSGDLTISSLDTIISGSLALDSSGDITLDADGDQITIKFGGATGQIDFTNENSGDGVIQQKVDAKDLVVKQYDGDEVVRFTDGGDVKVTNVVYFAAETANTIGNGATGVIDWNVSQKQKVTITGTGITCNFTNPPGPCNLMLKVIQGDGSDVIGTWDSDIKWPANGTAPTLSTGNGDIDILSFYFDGTNYFGVASLDFA